MTDRGWPKDGPIAFVDSGVGGLPYLSAARLALPGRRFAYLADRAGFPYGTKDRREVARFAVDAACRLAEATNPSALVIACNTATEHAIDEVRAALPGLPVVGTVPAIKPAAALPGVRRVGVIATQGAVSSEYLKKLIERWSGGAEVFAVGDGELVEFVERRYLRSSADERLAAVRPGVGALLGAGSDAIVLGCTHFVHLADEFASEAGPGVRIVDSRDGVVARLASLVGGERRSGREGAAGDQGGGTRGGGVEARGDDRLYLTGEGAPGPVYDGFAERFGLRFAGTLR